MLCADAARFEGGEITLGNVARDPVGRLHALLEQLFANANRSIGDVLAEDFQVSPDDTAEILRLYAEMAQLVVAGKHSVRRLHGFGDSELEDFFGPLDRVANALAQSNPRQQIRHLQSQIPPETMVGLKICSRLLSRDHPEGNIDVAQLQSLRDKLLALHAEIADGSFHSDLKEVLLRHIENMLRAIREFNVHGSAGLRETIEAAMGGGAIEIRKHSGETDREMLTKYAMVVGFGVTVLDLGLKSKELIEPWLKMLMPCS